MLGRFSSNLGLFLVSFALDYNGGMLSAIPKFEGSIHTTQLGLVLIGCFLRISETSLDDILRLSLKFVLPVIFLLFYGLISENALEYGSYKYDLFVWSMLIVACLAVSIKSVSSFRILILLGIFQMCVSILFSGLDPSEFRTGVGSPITASRIGGFLIIVLLFSSWLNNALRLAFGLLGIAVLLISGTRTPLIALALLLGLNILWPILKKRSIRRISIKSTLRIIVLFGMIVAFLVINPLSINARSIERTLSAFQSLGSFASSDGSTKERLLEWSMALESWYENPIMGGGTGDFGFLWFGYDRPMYPHNFLLELLCENGLVGLILIVSWIASVIPKRKLWLYPDVQFSVLVFIYSVIIGLSSLDFPNQFMLFLSLAFMLITSNIYGTNSLYIKK